MSFKLTTQQMRDRTKFVTRRNGWENINVGEVVNACVQCQGLKKGEAVEKICQIRVIEARREPLKAMAGKPEECVLEGFPELTPAEFIRFYCQANNCKPDKVITRIQFEYV